VLQEKEVEAWRKRQVPLSLKRGGGPLAEVTPRWWVALENKSHGDTRRRGRGRGQKKDARILIQCPKK